MSTISIPESPEADILTRLVRPNEAGLTPDAASALLALEFDERDLARMRELMAKSQAGELSEEERRVLEAYNKTGHFLALLKSKARQSLRRERDPK